MRRSLQADPIALVLLFLIALLSAVRPAIAQDSVNDVHIVPRVQPAPPPQLDINPALDTHTRPFRSDVDLVLVPVTVTDPDDRLVTGLEKHNFAIYQDKQQQTIQTLSSEDAPISVGIIFDMSGSMQDKIAGARQAVLDFMRTANPQDEFFVIGFSDKPELISTFTSSVHDIEGRLAFVQPKGLTALLDAIYLGLHEMKKAHNSRKALLIISDGGDNHSRFTEYEVKSRVQESDVQIYAIGLFDASPPTEEERLGPELLTDIAQATGGRMYTVDDPRDLTDVADKISVALRDEYVLSFRPKVRPRDGKWHKLKVKLLPPKGLPPLHVQAREGYYAPRR